MKHDVSSERVNGFAMGMRHDSISYLLGRNTCVKAKHTNTTKLKIMTDLKTVIDCVHILSFSRHLHNKSNQNLSLRKNWLLRLHVKLGHLQVQNLKWLGQKGNFGPIGKGFCNKKKVRLNMPHVISRARKEL